MTCTTEIAGRRLFAGDDARGGRERARNRAGRPRSRQDPRPDAACRRPWVAWLLALSAAACGGVADDDSRGAAPDGSGPDGPASAPAVVLAAGMESTTWRGDLPCADCAGIRTTITLRGDGIYRRTDAYLGLASEADTLSGSYGRWFVPTSGGGVVALVDGRGEFDRFNLTSDGGLEALDQAGAPIGSELNYRLSRVPTPDHAGDPVRLTGYFSYFADAALFMTCSDGIQLPVAMEGGYLDLERGYGASAAAGGGTLSVVVTGRVAPRPAMEGDEMEEQFVVETWEAVADVPCPAAQARAVLRAGTWALGSLDGAPAGVGAEGRAPTLSWVDETEIAGFAGCNQYSGRGVLRGMLFVTGPLASTRRFCEGSMELEGRVLEVLGTGGTWLRDGGEMVLYHGPEERARFVPAPTP